MAGFDKQSKPGSPLGTRSKPAPRPVRAHPPAHRAGRAQPVVPVARPVRPGRVAKPGRANLLVWAGFAIAAIILLGGLALGGYWLTHLPAEPAPQAQGPPAPPSPSPVQPAPAKKTPPPPPPMPQEQRQPEPALSDAVEHVHLAAAKLTPQQLFEQRIMPIFNSPNPSSCTQCHLSGFDLKDFILPSHEKTFRSLRDRGLIDLDRPAESKILKFIQKGAEDKNAALIHEKVRKLEQEAFAAWITACCNDPDLRNAPKLEKAEANQEKQQFEAQVKAAEKTDELLALFQKTIWAQKNRCAPCHMPGAKYQTEKKLVEKYGPKMNWMSSDGPAVTMNLLLTGKLINAAQPEKSLLILKGLNDIDALKALGEDPHGGGVKMKNGDPGHQAFLSWVTQAGKLIARRNAQRPNPAPPPGER